jgi:DNA polymerase I-like protein with 3'-5' exonuclease and polymerase domains
MKSTKFNLLAAPKSKDFMKCFIPQKGYKLIQADINALEPHVLAHASQDLSFLKVYGPDAKKGHDIYLMAGMRIPGIGDKIRPYYDVDNPDPEAIAKLKVELKDIRSNLIKPAYLGWMYGLGANTMSINLGIDFKQAKAILRGLETQFAGKVRLQHNLEYEWARNGGYIVNGRGRPVCVDKAYKKDLVNRYVQSTGVDLLNRILYHMTCYREDNNINVIPAIVNWHDETIWQVKDTPEEIKKARDMFIYGIDTLNKELNWSVVFKFGGINIGASMDLRCE